MAKDEGEGSGWGHMRGTGVEEELGGIGSYEPHNLSYLGWLLFF